MLRRNLLCCLAVFALLLTATTANAHFPWLTITEDGKAAYFFGENVADQTYHLPESVAKAEVSSLTADAKTQKIEVKPVETDDFVGLKSAAAVPNDATLISKVTYGIYQGSRLNYYNLHYGTLPTSLEAAKPAELPLTLSAKVVKTDAGIDVYATWEGKPLTDTEVHLYCDEGHEEGTAKTDAKGKVSFTSKQVEDGLNGLMLGRTVKDETGELNGKPYQSAAHYLTVTFIER